MKTGFPSHDGHQRKQNKPRSKSADSAWLGNPVALIAVCFTVVALVAAVIFNFHDSETVDSGDYASLRITGDITPDPASGTAIGAGDSLTSNGDVSEPQTPAVGSANPFQNTGLLQPAPAAVVTDNDAAEAQAGAPGPPTIADNSADQSWASEIQHETTENLASGATTSALNDEADNDTDADETEHPADYQIAGRVMTETGQPVAGVPITASLRRFFGPANQAATPSQTEQQTVSRADGAYAFNELADGEYLIRTEEVDHHAPAHAVVRRGVSFANLVLVAQQRLHINGTVTGRGGEEVVGAQVLPLVGGIPGSAYTAADGSFQLAVAYEAGRQGFPVLFRTKDYRELRLNVREVDRAESGSVELDVVLEPLHVTIPISGTVESQGMAVTGESVQLYSRRLKRSYNTIIDEVGYFLFPAVEVAEDYRLWIHPLGPYRDYELPNLDVTVQEPRMQIVLEPLETGPQLAGRMVDVNGEPVPGVTLLARSTRATNQFRQVTGDRQGRYEIDNAPTGELVFANRSMPYYTISGVRVSAEEHAQSNVSLVLDWGRHELGGRVLDDRDNPIPAPRIHLTWSHFENGVQSRSSRTTDADARGRFRFTGVGPGQHTLTVNAPGFEGVRLRHEVAAQGGDVVVRLEQRSSDFLKTSF